MDKQVSRYFQFIEANHKEITAAVSELPQAVLHFTAGGKVNSIAMLIKHTAGAEKLLIPQMVGGKTIQRNREEEFAAGDETAAVLLASLAESLRAARETLEELPDADLALEKEVTFSAGKRVISNEWAILHDLEHVAHHKGQIIMLKRLAQAQ